MAFEVGDKVKKVGGDYTFEGEVRSRFTKVSWLVRYVVEDDRGVLHVYNERNPAPNIAQVDYAAVERRIVVQANPDWAERPVGEGRLVKREPMPAGMQNDQWLDEHNVKKTGPKQPRLPLGDESACPVCGARHPPDGMCINS